MELIKEGMAGTMESSDINIKISPNQGKGIKIQLRSAVEKQYGDVIRQVIKETLMKIGVEDAKVVANDKGALDYAIKARVQTAAFRAANQENAVDWEVL